MKLCVSALAWNASDENAALNLLSQHNVRYVEHIPVRIGDPAAKLAQLEALKITPCAFQALLFGTKGLQVFGEEEEQEALLEHLERVAKQAAILGARALVFGSPKNRWIDERRHTPESARLAALRFFRKAGEVVQRYSALLCLEPNPKEYGCNFLTTTVEVLDFLEEAASSGLALNLDTGALFINCEKAEDILQRATPFIGHVHLSEPKLMPLGVTSAISRHEAVARALSRSGYAGVVSIEMQCVDSWPSAVGEAIAFARRVYGAL